MGRILPFLLAFLAACSSTPGKLIDGRLAPGSWMPNNVSSDGAGANIQPLEFAGPPDVALDSLITFLQAPHTVRCGAMDTLEGDDAELILREESYAHLLYRTQVLRFTDDVELRLDAADRVIHVRSASRLGFWDLGTNRARVESIRERWQQSE